MGRNARMRREQGNGSTPPAKPWCDHCLDLLHNSACYSPITEAIVDAYMELRRTSDSGHAEAIDWIEKEVGVMLQALKSSGDRYHRDQALESKAYRWGEYSVDRENPEPEPWTPDEIAEYDALLERDRARDERRRMEAD